VFYQKLFQTADFYHLPLISSQIGYGNHCKRLLNDLKINPSSFGVTGGWEPNYHPCAEDAFEIASVEAAGHPTWQRRGIAKIAGDFTESRYRSRFLC
jgi:hypothetical protein